MPRFLDTTGRSTLGIGLCARCSRKFSIEDLGPDPNFPGFMVCKDDMDELDPYRLAPPEPDVINLPFVRPDAPISTTVNIADQIPGPFEEGGPATILGDSWYGGQNSGPPPDEGFVTPDYLFTDTSGLSYLVVDTSGTPLLID